MKKHIILFVAFLITLNSLSIDAYAKYQTNFDINAQSVYLKNIDTGEVILDINSDEKLPAGNMTKLMTAIIAVEHSPEPIEEAVGIMNMAMQNYLYERRPVTLSGFLTNPEFERVTIEKLLYAILLPGGNDAALMIADYVGDGSEEYFVSLMNDKARELGAHNTSFVNSHGIEGENGYTTAYDMSLIINYALENPLISSILTTTTYDGGPTNNHSTLIWNNSNKTVVPNSSTYYPAISGGIQSNYINYGGYSFASMASKDGYNYALVLMGAEAETDVLNPAVSGAVKIYEWVFSAFSVKTVVDKGEMLAEVPLRLAAENKDHLKLMSGEMLTALLPETLEISSITMELNLPETVNSPVEQGDYIGTATFILAGEEIGTVEIQSAETVAASSFSVFVDDALEITESFWFKFGVILVILLIIAYIVMMILYNKKKRHYRRGRR